MNLRTRPTHLTTYWVNIRGLFNPTLIYWVNKLMTHNIREGFKKKKCIFPFENPKTLRKISINWCWTCKISGTLVHTSLQFAFVTINAA